MGATVSKKKVDSQMEITILTNQLRDLQQRVTGLEKCIAKINVQRQWDRQRELESSFRFNKPLNP
ncbi:hypothetical protein EB118_11620 [bacterium]|nr:hypothetical protein [bacterium]